MIGKFSLICSTITLGLMLPMSTYASCVEYMKEAGAVEGVVPKVVYGSDSSGDTGAAEADAYNRAVALAMDTVVSRLQQKGLG